MELSKSTLSNREQVQQKKEQSEPPNRHKLTTKNNLIIFGQRGSGKTLTAKFLTKPERRLLILDTFREHDYGFICHSISDAIDQLEREEFCCVLRDFSIDDNLKWLFHCVSERGDMCIYIEELSWYCKAQWSIPYLRELLRNSRHSQVRFVATSQMPKQIDKEIVGLCSCYCGNLHEPNAIRYLKEISKGAEKVKDLPLPQVTGRTAKVAMYDLMGECEILLDVPLQS